MLWRLFQSQEIIKPSGVGGQRFLDLLNQLLQWDPARRITPEDALQHAFFHVTIDDEGSNSILKRSSSNNKHH